MRNLWFSRMICSSLWHHCSQMTKPPLTLCVCCCVCLHSCSVRSSRKSNSCWSCKFYCCWFFWKPPAFLSLLPHSPTLPPSLDPRKDVDHIDWQGYSLNLRPNFRTSAQSAFVLALVRTDWMITCIGSWSWCPPQPAHLVKKTKPQHVFQRCSLHQAARQDAWPTDTPFTTKLCSCSQELEKMASFNTRTKFVV